MNNQTKTAVAIIAIMTALALVTAATLAGISDQAFAASGKQGGPKAQKNNGQCKKTGFNEKVCKKFHTSSG
jgi:hypothetical protein